MKLIAVVIAVSIVPVSLLGCSGHSHQATNDESPERQPLAKKDILLKAKSEIAKLGLTPPDDDMMKALDGLGFKPTVTPFNDGWKVSHPLGHPYAICWIHLEMDSGNSSEPSSATRRVATGT